MAPALVVTAEGAIPEITGAKAPPHEWRPEALLRGFGAAAVKSVAFWSVSVQPRPPRWSEVVLLGAGAGPVPSKAVAVAEEPIRSMICEPVGLPPVSAVVLL